MLELNAIRAEPERLIEGLKKRNFQEEELSIVNQIIALDDQRKSTQTDLDQTLAERNRLSKEIGDLFKQNKREEAESMRAQVGELKEQASEMEDQLKNIQSELTELLYTVPNIPHPSVPSGNTDDDNEVFKAWSGELPELGDDAKPHWELAKDYGIFDLELGVKITGAGFPVYRGKGAKLQRALISFFLDEATEAGYDEVIPPLLVNENTARATGQLPDKEGQMYYVNEDNLYLIPTAEVPVTNIYRDVILEEDDFPIKLTGYTPCFRREAGSYGAHVRGLNRVHQFDKVEIVRIEHPDRSYDSLMEMLGHVERILEKLELPYRILRLCGGDLGFTSALTFDFEVYSAAQKRWLEVSSVSNFETYQANRLKLRYRSENGNRLAHTLNGSALALARIVAALIENNQTPEGIVIPEKLRSYTGFSVLS
ncbi:serine--tRNA ligase [Flavilitoribacter nigricans]|uniref:Serine--tRNA ligase n=1 Tax=Flavilitoribacter nigricans (strain ATCC 23147 / DSM 23189 / NBRC 102662 / NCIMB 1420 / SS-2) TaxID=1122177 RepID=A0A2D0NIQ9_FLAN2|nr:serine--tRNA ligase [Flavilitoribacter nigricans]PHN08079.1 serine--tRNA ligase [Flavilitoribacter nigricans DSM 23189 = NBRC 102662]